MILKRIKTFNPSPFRLSPVSLEWGDLSYTFIYSEMIFLLLKIVCNCTFFLWKYKFSHHLQRRAAVKGQGFIVSAAVKGQGLIVSAAVKGQGLIVSAANPAKNSHKQLVVYLPFEKKICIEIYSKYNLYKYPGVFSN